MHELPSNLCPHGKDPYECEDCIHANEQINEQNKRDEVECLFQVGDQLEAVAFVVAQDGKADLDSILEYIAASSAFKRPFVDDDRVKEIYKRVLKRRMGDAVARTGDIMKLDFDGDVAAITFVAGPKRVEDWKKGFANTLARVKDFTKK